MSLEPKYKLNQKEAKRWHALCTRHCLEGFVQDPKFPPLTPEENVEFKRLDQKRHQKIISHPRMQQSLRQQAERDAALAKTVQRLERLLAK